MGELLREISRLAKCFRRDRSLTQKPSLVQFPDPTLRKDRPRLALVGNPNAGKTTLFNSLTGLRAKTANFPGTTIERRIGTLTASSGPLTLVDLPGLYSLSSATPEERIARDALLGEIEGERSPDALILLMDATHLERNLYLASQVLELKIPTVIALNMMDLARKEGIEVDLEALSRKLRCPVVPVVARNGEGLPELRNVVSALLQGYHPASHEALIDLSMDACACSSCPFEKRFNWAEEVRSQCVSQPRTAPRQRTEFLDSILTHPVGGILAFFAVMFAVFALIFWLADYPMTWIDGGFAEVGQWAETHLPEGDLQGLLVEGVIGGVGGVLVFLPQICILFFLLSLLEDTGYLARAAFVMDRMMRRVGLPGRAFVPMLSAHACAIPGIMASRAIENKRDRLVTILVLPLMSCSARIPVYAMLTVLLFPHDPFMASLVFTGAYVLGIVAAITMAWVFKKSILPGETSPLVLELPSYKAPSLRNAMLATWDRARIFVKKAGTTILVISVVLWVLATYPKVDPPNKVTAMQTEASHLEVAGLAEDAEILIQEASRLEGQHALAHSAAGRIGLFIEPVLQPLGFDWQIGVGIISSFAAREVIVSTLSVIYGVGEGEGEDGKSLYDALRDAERSDGTPVFTFATSLSLLIFYILAMQCLPTQVVTRRETGTWKWPLFQLGFMTVLAYSAALLVYQSMLTWGG